MDVTLTPCEAASLRCAICHGEDLDGVLLCPGCRTRVHAECRDPEASHRVAALEALPPGTRGALDVDLSPRLVARCRSERRGAQVVLADLRQALAG